MADKQVFELDPITPIVGTDKLVVSDTSDTTELKSTDIDQIPLNILGTPLLDVDFNTKKLLRVADGTLSTDGVNKSQLDTKAGISHTHPQSEITNLVTDLSNKSAVGHTHVAANISNFDSAVSANSAVAANTAKRTYPLADENKLAAIEANATADQTGAEIKSAYEGEANAFNDTKNTKLNGISTGAEVNPDVIPQAEAEAGTATTERIFTAQRVAQAIAALESGGGGSTDAVNWKKPVRVATNNNGNLALHFENGDSIDGVSLVTGDRILIKDQTDGSQNGIYTVNASGAPTRATDFDGNDEVSGAVVVSLEGTANGGKAWLMTNTGAITIGTTALTFTEFGAGGGATDTEFAIPLVQEIPEGSVGYPDIHDLATASAHVSGMVLPDVSASTINLKTMHPIPDDLASTPAARIEFILMTKGAVAGPADVRLTVSSLAVADGENFDQSFTSEVETTVTMPTATETQDVYSQDMTTNPVAGDTVLVQLARDPADVADDFTDDIQIISATLYIQRST